MVEADRHVLGVATLGVHTAVGQGVQVFNEQVHVALDGAHLVEAVHERGVDRDSSTVAAGSQGREVGHFHVDRFGRDDGTWTAVQSRSGLNLGVQRVGASTAVDGVAGGQLVGLLAVGVLHHAGIENVVASIAAEVVQAHSEGLHCQTGSAVQDCLGGRHGCGAGVYVCQDASVCVVDQQLFGGVACHFHLVGQHDRGIAPHGVGRILGSQVGEDVENDVAARQAGIQGGNDVGLGFSLGSVGGAVADDVSDQCVGKLLVCEERRVLGSESWLRGVDVDDFFRRQAEAVGFVELAHVLNARGGAESDNEELICVSLLLIGHCH